MKHDPLSYEIWRKALELNMTSANLAEDAGKSPKDWKEILRTFAAIKRLYRDLGQLFDNSELPSLERLALVDQLVSQKRCPHCLKVEIMKVIAVQAGEAFTCLNCGWQGTVLNSELTWITRNE